MHNLVYVITTYHILIKFLELTVLMNKKIFTPVSIFVAYESSISSFLREIRYLGIRRLGVRTVEGHSICVYTIKRSDAIVDGQHKVLLVFPSTQVGFA